MPVNGHALDVGLPKPAGALVSALTIGQEHRGGRSRVPGGSDLLHDADRGRRVAYPEPADWGELAAVLVALGEMLP
jgi:hypothetical protein